MQNWYKNKIQRNIEYNKNNTTRINLTLNNNTDDDIIQRLNMMDNKSGYIKDLIRQDIANCHKYTIKLHMTNNGTHDIYSTINRKEAFDRYIDEIKELINTMNASEDKDINAIFRVELYKDNIKIAFRSYAYDVNKKVRCVQTDYNREHIAHDIFKNLKINN